jgi:hypothetical protein
MAYDALFKGAVKLRADVCALSQPIPLICLCAFDHFCLFSWSLPLPKEISRVAFL